MSRRLLGWAVVLVVAGGCAASRQAERAQGVRVQELQGTVEDLQQRIAFETAEKGAVSGTLQKVQEELASCRTDAASERGRIVDLDRRLRRCEDSDAGLRADQDLERRAREAAEQDRDALRRRAQAASDENAAQGAALRKEIEDCRGRLADAEAQASLLVAETRKGELVARERVEEVTCNYDRLLQEARAEADVLRQRAAELEASLEAETARTAQAGARLGAREAADRSAEDERARRHEEISRLRAALAAALGDGSGASGWSLVADEDRAAVQGPVAAVFAPRSTELRPGARDALRRLAPLARGAELSAAVQAQVSGVRGELAKKFPTAWDLAAAYAAKVARLVEKEAGLAPERLTIGAARLVSRPEAQEGAVASVTLELRLSEGVAPLPAAEPESPPPATEP